MPFDEKYKKLISPDNKKSFFLFAGAGTGKTYTLVEMLRAIKDSYAKTFELAGQQCAVITFTNAATDEIRNRLKDTSIFSISTIHSFLWSLISPFQKDIKTTYIQFKNEELQEIEAKINKNKNSKSKLEKYQDRKQELEQEIETAREVEKFSYDPNGDNISRNSLNHADVIKIGSYLIREKSMLQTILVGSYPILLIDEGQDTNKNVIQAFLTVQNSHPEDFKLGILGDTKQQIYFDGEPNIENELNDNWVKDHLSTNWRSDNRIVNLSNKIAALIDPNAQVIPRYGVKEGFVHLFIKEYTKDLDRVSVESSVCNEMKIISVDSKWIDGPVKKLLLEHRMAASRLGFEELYDNLHSIGQGFLDGSIPEMFIFKNILLPISNMTEERDFNGIFQIVKEYSPLFDKKGLYENSKTPLKELHTLNKVVTELEGLLNNDASTIREIIKFVDNNNIFPIPPIIKKAMTEREMTEDINELKEVTDVSAWRKSLDLPFSQVKNYLKYVTGQSEFATHQGVKGLEYDRVLVIIDENAAKGRMFSYDKLFGVKPLSPKDKTHIDNNEDNAISRTLRLFYVVCTRAKHSLAILAYTSNPSMVQKTCEDNGWFNHNEITIL